MLNFDPDRYVRIQSGAVALAGRLHETVSQCLGSGARNLFFAGTGGAGILMLPAAQLLESRSTFPVHVVNPAELVELGNVNLGPDSLVVIPSLSGTTRESLAALRFCQEAGAKVLTLTGHEDSPLAQLADHSFVNFAEDDTSCESFYLQSLALALAILDVRGEGGGSVAAQLSALSTLPELLLGVKEQAEPAADATAARLQDSAFHIITGAGSTWAEAFYYGMCILEEMQWIRTRPVHASDFFHGTLELLEPGVSLVLLKGEDAARPLVERVEKFAPSVTDQVLTLDSADYDLPGLPSDVRPLVSPVVLSAVLERVSAHLEVRTDHPLTTRRYYKRVDY
jgi:fructoselysine-6-phosphate deglycase